MKRQFAIRLVIFFCLLVNVAYAQYKLPLLVMDMSNVSQLPNHFRTTQDHLPANVKTEGLTDLHMAGGSQFSKAAFKRILIKIRQSKVFIIDLRQESHGFLNGNAISWYAPNDAINAGKTDEEIEASQTELLDALAKRDVVDVFSIVTKSRGYVTKVRAKQYAVHQVMSEAQFAADTKQDYQRIYVQDTQRPDDAQVDRFLETVGKIPATEWVYFHCRAGVGRTTTFMTMYDMLHNAKTLTFEEILARQHALGGKDLGAITEVAPNKKQSAQVRLDFLKKFYEYAKTNDDHYKTSWTAWLAKR